MDDAQAQLAGFAAKYSPEICARGLAAIERLHARFPTAARLVYDNYNALAVGFGPDERASNAIVSIAFYPKWVSLFFLQAKALEDREGLLRGSGTVARHIVLKDASDLDHPAISELIDQAEARAKTPLPRSGEGPLIIRSVSAKQRPRRPEEIGPRAKAS